MKQSNQQKTGRKKLYSFWECVEWQADDGREQAVQEESVARPRFCFIGMVLVAFVLVTLVAVLIMELLGF